MFGLLDGNAIYGGKLRFKIFSIKTVIKFSYYLHSLTACTSTFHVPYWYLSHNSCTFPLVPFWSLFGTLEKMAYLFRVNFRSSLASHNYTLNFSQLRQNSSIGRQTSRPISIHQCFSDLTHLQAFPGSAFYLIKIHGFRNSQIRYHHYVIISNISHTI